MNTTDFINDIPLETAYRAHSGTSFVPEKRAESTQADYAETLASDFADLEKLADTPEKKQLLTEEFARYRLGYRRRTLDYLGSRSGLMSTMIAGPANFPVRRMEKKNNAIQKRLNELIEYRERALDAIKKKLCPGLRPIMSGDDDAVERLQEKIDKAERLQEVMRAANKITRKAPKNQPTEEKIAAIVALGLSETTAQKLFQPDYMGRVGFPGFELSNNNANIKRMKDRLETITAAKQAEETTIEGENARLEDCPADNRIRLFFPGKPDADVRQQLKRSGFRWTPSLGCWQAYRNYRTQEMAQSFAGVQLQPATS